MAELAEIVVALLGGLVRSSRLVGSDLRTCHRFWSDYRLQEVSAKSILTSGLLTIRPETPSRTLKPWESSGPGSMTEGLNERELFLLAYLFCHYFATPFAYSVGP
jgi:hypothetical protein